MRKVFILAVSLSILCIGCMNANTDMDDEFSVILTELTGANIINYAVITNETSHFAEVAEYIADMEGKILSKHTVGNSIIERRPLSTSGIVITFDQDETYFGVVNTGPLHKPFYREMYRVPIEDGDYNIDSRNKITLTQSFEDSVNANMERHRESGELGLRQEEDSVYWTMAFDVLLESSSDPFNILFNLIKQNADSFKLVDSDTGHITYVGGIDPDTIVDYYMNDGKSAFGMLFYGYEGEMTREALMNEMIATDYNAMFEGFNALLFTDEHVPVTISKDLANGTYGITIIMTEAQNALNAKRYVDLDFSVVIDESTIEYTNMVLE